MFRLLKRLVCMLTRKNESCTECITLIYCAPHLLLFNGKQATSLSPRYFLRAAFSIPSRRKKYKHGNGRYARLQSIIYLCIQVKWTAARVRMLMKSGFEQIEYQLKICIKSFSDLVLVWGFQIVKGHFLMENGSDWARHRRHDPYPICWTTSA